jgi:hypothetical protein
MNTWEHQLVKVNAADDQVRLQRPDCIFGRFLEAEVVERESVMQLILAFLLTSSVPKIMSVSGPS